MAHALQITSACEDDEQTPLKSEPMFRSRNHTHFSRAGLRHSAATTIEMDVRVVSRSKQCAPINLSRKSARSPLRPGRTSPRHHQEPARPERATENPVGAEALDHRCRSLVETMRVQLPL